MAANAGADGAGAEDERPEQGQVQGGAAGQAAVTAVGHHLPHDTRAGVELETFVARAGDAPVGDVHGPVRSEGDVRRVLEATGAVLRGLAPELVRTIARMSVPPRGWSLAPLPASHDQQAAPVTPTGRGCAGRHRPRGSARHGRDPSGQLPYRAALAGEAPAGLGESLEAISRYEPVAPFAHSVAPGIKTGEGGFDLLDSRPGPTGQRQHAVALDAERVAFTKAFFVAPVAESWVEGELSGRSRQSFELLPVRRQAGEEIPSPGSQDTSSRGSVASRVSVTTMADPPMSR